MEGSVKSEPRLQEYLVGGVIVLLRGTGPGGSGRVRRAINPGLGQGKLQLLRRDTAALKVTAMSRPVIGRRHPRRESRQEPEDKKNPPQYSLLPPTRHRVVFPGLEYHHDE